MAKTLTDIKLKALGDRLYKVDGKVEGVDVTLKSWKSSTFNADLEKAAADNESVEVTVEERVSKQADREFKDKFIVTLNGKPEKAPAGGRLGGGGGFRKPDRTPGAEASILVQTAMKCFAEVVAKERALQLEVLKWNAEHPTAPITMPALDKFTVSSLVTSAKTAIAEIAPLMKEGAF